MAYLSDQKSSSDKDVSPSDIDITMSATSASQTESTPIHTYGTTVDASSGSIKDSDYGYDRVHSRSPSNSSVESEQAGVKTIEAIAQAWTAWSLASAYAGVFLIACATSLEGQTTYNLTPIATSTFGDHSLISTVTVVQGVVLAVMKPPIAKLANVFGRLEAYSFSVLIFVLGYVQEAASQNIKTFASAQIFYATGSTGVQYLQQLFIADTTDLRNRALFSSIVDTPFLATVWLGPIIANKILHETTFRWGYGIWAIVLPVCFLPLALSLFINMHKAKKLGFIRKSPLRDMSTLQILKYMWYELDFFGLLLLSAAISLILLPLTLAQMARGKWANPSMIAMLVVGGICLIAFPLWERSKKLAPQAFFPRELFRERTVCAGVALAFFYFMVYYLSVQPYFYSYLLVVQNMSVTSAGHVTQVFSFTSSVTAVIAGLIAKYTGHYKWFMTLGTCIYLLGIGLMIKYRTETASVGALVGCQIVVGIGGGLTNVLAQLGVQASVSHQGVASATAVFLTTLEIGGAVGSAISGSIWSSSIPARLERYLPENAKMEAASIYGSVLVASERYPPGTPERAAINRAYQETMTNLLTVAVCVCVPVIICSLFMKNYDLRKIDQKVKGRVIGGQDTSDGLPESLNQSSVRCED